MNGRDLLTRLLSYPPMPTAAARNAVLIAAALAVAAIALAAALALPGTTFTTFALWDPLIFVDNAYRLQQGQFPHREFHSSLGVLTMLFPYLGLELGGSFGACLPTALALVLVASTPLAIYVLATRVRLAIALPYGVFLLVVIASPMTPGGVPSKITMALWYNRECWALLALLFTLYLPPYARTAMVRVADGVAAAMLILVLVYTKITYGLVALTFPAIWWALDKDARRSAVLAASLVATVIVAVELIWGLNRLYLADIAFALRSGPTLRGGLLQPIDTLFIHAEETALMLGAVLLLWWARAGSARDYVFLLIVLGAGAVVTNQNTHDYLLISNTAIIVIATERLARAAPAGGAQHASLLVWPVVLGLLLTYIAQPVVYHGLGLIRHVRSASTVAPDPVLPASLRGFAVAEFKELSLQPGSAEAFFPAVIAPGLALDDAFEMIRIEAPGRDTAILSSTEYWFMVARGIEALAGIDDQGGSIFVFDSINPFNFALGKRPSTSHLFSYDFNRQFSKDNYIPADATFATVSLAMMPKFQIGHHDRQALEELYGDYLREHFEIVRDTPYWTVWRRHRLLTAR